MSSNSSPKKSVLLAGATGLVGSHCLRLLQHDTSVGRIVAITRRPLPPETSSPHTEEILVDFDNLDTYETGFVADQVFICLGTSLKAAGSRAAFHKVDYTYSLAVAKLAVQSGAKDLMLVSVMGAALRSPFFYSRTKAELELAVQKLPFRSISILRPSMLLGTRDQSRRAELAVARLSKAFTPFYKGPLKRLQPVEAADVARVMVRLAANPTSGVTIVESRLIHELSAAGSVS